MAESHDYAEMRVVLIDDDVMVLNSLRTALSDLGFTVEAFSSPLEALKSIKEHGADVVISDILMPECDGFGVLKRVKEIDPQCDLILITAHSQMEIAIRALREGAADFIEKPFTIYALQAAMERTQRFRTLMRHKNVLADRVDVLSGELAHRDGNHNVMLGQSQAMRKVAREIVDIAATSATVLLLGESGTGKELAAAAIHQAGERATCPFLTLNCPSIPADLFESEMFGHRRGSFTGAVETTGGYVQAAQGGTLFLDEIGDLPLPAQGKILRLLEEKRFLPVGEQSEKQADVRIIAATNQDLNALANEKAFRQDLFYRLNVCTITLPPLRERKEDVPTLALYFALRYGCEMGKVVDGIDDEALRLLTGYDYPGNVRELRNIVESSIIHCRHSGKLRAQDLRNLSRATTALSEEAPPAWAGDCLDFETVERTLYQEALQRTNTNVSAAARLLGISRGKLRRRLAALGIREEGA